jgi:hypothetical protein
MKKLLLGPNGAGAVAASDHTVLTAICKMLMKKDEPLQHANTPIKMESKTALAKYKAQLAETLIKEGDNHAAIGFFRVAGGLWTEVAQTQYALGNVYSAELAEKNARHCSLWIRNLQQAINAHKN